MGAGNSPDAPMPPDDPVVPRLVRLVIVTNHDAGFQFWWQRVEERFDVPPGGEYVVECMSPEPVLIGEVLVRDFALVQISTGARTVKAPRVERGDLPRLYRLDPAIPAQGDQGVAALLRNDSTIPLKQKIATLVRVDVTSTRGEATLPERSEDAVPCPFCGKGPGNSCDAPASHRSRIDLHNARASAPRRPQ